VVEKLKEVGILPWVDVEQLRPGSLVQKILNKQIKRINTAAVFIGKKGIGPWQEAEQEALISQFAKRKTAAVIPVILPESPKVPRLPPLLERFAWVDFRKTAPDPLKALVWGITGNAPSQGRFKLESPPLGGKPSDGE
jgi:hypothetical protein